MVKYIPNRSTKVRSLSSKLDLHAKKLWFSAYVLSSVASIVMYYAAHDPTEYEPVCVQQTVRSLVEHQQTAPYQDVLDVCSDKCRRSALDKLLTEYDLDPVSAIDYANKKCAENDD